MSDSNTRIDQYSLPGQLSAIDINENVTRSKYVPPEELSNLNEIKKQMRNWFSPSVARAKERTGYEYSWEIATMITDSGNVYVVGVITRVG